MVRLYQIVLEEERPLVVKPKLAKVIGLNEAIVIQQLNYWLNKSKHFKDGCMWSYNTYKEWAEQFPFWSEKTIRRIINKLEKEGLIISTDKYNKMPMDKTKWYTINVDVLDDKLRSAQMGSPCGQNDQSMRTTCPSAYGQNDHTNNHRLPETTTKTNDQYIVIYEKWINSNIIKHKKLTSKMKTQIKNALADYELDDILKAIENYSTVLHSPKHYFSYKWTLDDFLARGLKKFVDEAEPLVNFLSIKNKGEKKVYGSYQPNYKDDTFQTPDIDKLPF